MGIAWNIARVLIASITIVIVAEFSKRFPRYGALLLSLPIVSILAFMLSWFQHHDLPVISKLARGNAHSRAVDAAVFCAICIGGAMGTGILVSLSNRVAPGVADSGRLPNCDDG